jgi:hypothetical protein
MHQSAFDLKAPERAPYAVHVRDIASRLETKNPACGDFAEPSDGLEPSTPSLPCAAKRLPWVVTGCGSACLSGFRARPICHRLPPVAPAGLHKCSIHSPGIVDGQRASGVQPSARRVLSPLRRRGSFVQRRWLITTMNACLFIAVRDEVVHQRGRAFLDVRQARPSRPRPGCRARLRERVGAAGRGRAQGLTFSS